MKKKRIIIFADHCNGRTAYGRLCSYVADDLYNSGKYDVIVCGIDYKNVQTEDYYKLNKPYPVYSFYPDIQKDPQAVLSFVRFLSKANVQYDIILTINDIWQLWHLPNYLHDLRKRQNRKFLWCNWFPVDQVVRQAWLSTIKMCDYPVVMSDYGYQQLKDHEVKYHRVKIDRKKYFKITDEAEIKGQRDRLYVSEKDILFAVVGKNQKRKNILDLIKTFKIFHDKYPNTYLYLHTDVNGFDGNIDTYVDEVFKDRKDQPVRIKDENIRCLDEAMNRTYNAIDALIVPSIAEGVCLPIYEAQLAGCVVIGADNTSITEALSDGKGILVQNSSEKRRMSMRENGKLLDIELPVFDVGSMLAAMEVIYHGEGVKEIAEKGRLSAEEYQEKHIDWVEYFEEIYKKEEEHADEMEKKRKKRGQWIKEI